MMKRLFALCLAPLLLTALLTACGAAPEGPPLNQKWEVSEGDIALAKQLLADKNLEATDRIVAAVANDMQRLENTFWREAVAIEEIQAFDVLYSITYDAAGEKDLVRVTEDGSGPINVTVINGDNKDVWVYRSSGQIIFNGLSLRTHCKDTEGGAAALQVLPAACFNQSPQDRETLMTDAQYRFSGKEEQAVACVPMPETTNTLSSRLNALAVSAAEGLTQLGCDASGAEAFAAVGAALAENRELAGQVLAEAADGPSYQIFQYASQDASAYVITAFQNKNLSGASFVWGVREQNP